MHDLMFANQAHSIGNHLTSTPASWPEPRDLQEGDGFQAVPAAVDADVKLGAKPR